MPQGPYGAEYQYLTGEAQAPKVAHVQENRCFPFIVAVCVLEGQYQVSALAGEKLVAHAGEAVVVPENLPHIISMPGPGKLNWAHFCCRFCGRDVLSALSGPCLLQGKDAALLSERCQRLTALSPKAEGQHHLSALLEQDRMVAQIGASLLSALSLDLPMLSPPIQAAVACLDQRRSHPPALWEVAAAAGLSVSALEKRFHVEMGRTPLQYQLERRLQLAVLLLLQGRCVYEAAEEAGFSDPYYFSKVFKKKMGLSPSSYLRQYRGGGL